MVAGLSWNGARDLRKRSDRVAAYLETQGTLLAAPPGRAAPDRLPRQWSR
jgi:hypothetical protein